MDIDDEVNIFIKKLLKDGLQRSKKASPPGVSDDDIMLASGSAVIGCLIQATIRQLPEMSVPEFMTTAVTVIKSLELLLMGSNMPKEMIREVMSGVCSHYLDIDKHTP